MSFHYSHVGGPDLNQRNVQILEDVDNFVFRSSVGDICLGDIHKDYMVIVDDSASRTYDISLDLDKIKTDLDNLTNEFEYYRCNHSDYQKLDSIGCSINNMKILLKKYKGEEGIIKIKSNIDLLGLCDNRKKTITIFNGLVNCSSQVLAEVYVHEMMHAFYKTKYTEERIEEPIVEYSMLKFIEAFEIAHPNYMNLLNHSINDVRCKQNVLGITHYGFGCYLFESSKYDWIKLYKGHVAIRRSKLLTEYENYFNDVYPFIVQDDVEILLYNVLTQKSASPKLPIFDCPGNPSLEKKLNDEWNYILRWKYFKSNDTLCLDGFCPDIDSLIERDEHNSYKNYEQIDELRNLLYGITNLYLGPNFQCKDFRDIRLSEIVHETIYVSSKNKTFFSQDNLLFTKDNHYLIFCNRDSIAVTIPNSVTEIGDFAFVNCTELDSVVIPNSVTEIGDFAFVNCAKLKSVIIPNSVIEIGESAFSDCTSLTSVIIPNSVIDIQLSAFSGCKSLTSVTIPNSVIDIQDSAFEDCTSLTSVIIPNSVIAIEDFTFSGCKSLTSVTISNSVTKIGCCAFEGCYSLINIYIPDSVKKIESRAFADCTCLKEISVPSDCKIADNAFDGCPGKIICRK